MSFNSNFVTTYCPISITVAQQFVLNNIEDTEYRLERRAPDGSWIPVASQMLRLPMLGAGPVSFTFAQAESYDGQLRIFTTPRNAGPPPYGSLVDSTPGVPFRVICTPPPQKVAIRTVSIAANPVGSGTSSGACPYPVHFTVTVTSDPLPAGVDGDIRAVATSASGAHPQTRLSGLANGLRTYDVNGSSLTSVNGLMSVVVTSSNQVSASTPYHIACTSSDGGKERKDPPRSHP